MHIFLTGQPASGKTTIVKRVSDHLRSLAQGGDGGVSLAGFYTEEVREGDSRVGFDVVSMGNSGKKAKLSRIEANPGRARPMVGKYVVDVDSFEALALSELSEEKVEACEIIVIDEVGKMELYSEAFYPRVVSLLDESPIPILGVIPSPRYGRTIDRVERIRNRSDTIVRKVTRTNREELFHKVLEDVMEALREKKGKRKREGEGQTERSSYSVDKQRSA